MEKEEKLNLKTLEFERKRREKLKEKKTNNKKNNKLLFIVLVVIILIAILIIVFGRAKSPKYIINDFYTIAKKDEIKAKNKYRENQKFLEQVDEILSSRFKYQILDIKEVTNDVQKNNKIKIYDAKVKLSNVDRRKAKTEASKKTSNELKIGTEEYNNEYLKNLKEAVKKEEIKTVETTIKLKLENGKWYIINTGNTDII